ncbi:MAG: carboxylating nicotinate-nucleotide diphosphorylase, partial [Planctomycetia bacterium]
MFEFSNAERAACQRLLDLARIEDFGLQGDVTSRSVLDAGARGRARLVARETGVVAGLEAVRLVVEMAPGLEAEHLAADGPVAP